VLDKSANVARVGISGVAAKPYRATAVETALQGKELTEENIREAAAKAAEGVESLNDIHASAEFRAHLAQVNTRRALEKALNR
jgi:carbon-monoxide dehydrogenase medium subunit